MQFPRIAPMGKQQEITTEFKGFNHNLSVGDGEFYNMKNMTSKYYPVLSTRDGRGILKTFTKPQMLFGRNKPVWIDNDVLYYNAKSIGSLPALPAGKERQLVSMGAYLVIFPDNRYVNLEKTTFSQEDILPLGATVQTGSSQTTFSLCDMEGKDYAPAYTKPEKPTDGQYWLDGSAGSLKVYSQSMAMWQPVATTYVRISSPALPGDIKKYDTVTISGVDGTVEKDLAKFNGDMVVWNTDTATHSICVTGLISKPLTQSGTKPVTFCRVIPKLDYVTELNNRIWGCHYGLNSKNEPVNEIYACKQGDPTNWFNYMGLSGDSYTASLGSDGPFTGAATYGGYVLFFKENRMHKVYGTKPANYQIQDLETFGVQSGCHRSIQTVGGKLMYKSPAGFCAYDGALPMVLDRALGQDRGEENRYSHASAGTDGSKYYVSCKGVDGRYSLLVYDSTLGIWHREDDTQVKYFAAVGGELYFIDETSKKLLNFSGNLSLPTLTEEPFQDMSREGAFDWMVETGDLGDYIPENKYYSRIGIRMEPGANTTVEVYLQYDQKAYEKQATLTGSGKKKMITLPIRPHRCDHMRLKICGTGPCKIWEMTRYVEGGGQYR